jgi:hypothetical protein
MNPFKWVERKVKMNIIEKLLVSFIERTWKNRITTFVGVFGVALYAFNHFGILIPAQYHDIANMVAVIVQGVALALAKDSGQKNIDIPVPTKLLAVLLLIGMGTLLTATASAQTSSTTTTTLPTNVYAAGVSYNNGNSTPVAGTALYARVASAENGTFAFTALDVLPTAYKPFTVSTNVSVGVAQKVWSLNGITFYMPTSAGVSITGSNTGWTWTGGILADYPIKRKGVATSYRVMPNVRFLKSSVSNGSDYQLIAGVMIGIGTK